MHSLTQWVRRYPVMVFCVLPLALVWVTATLPLPPVLPLVLTVLLPATSAILVSAALGGRPAVGDLLRRMFIWRVGWRWYAVVLGVPVVCGLVAQGINRLLPPPTAPLAAGQLGFGGFTPAVLLFYILAIGEEIGWRGFLLPQLLRRYAPLAASLMVGVVWAIYHLVIFWPQGVVLSGSLILIAESIIITWVFLHTRESVLLAVLFHGTQSAVLPLFYAGMDVARLYWLQALVYGVVAVGIVALTGASLTGRNVSSVRKAAVES